MSNQEQQPAIRERVAYIHRGEASGLDPEAITLEDGHLTVPKFEAVREDRLTIPLEGLPAEVVTHIKAFASLSLRWTSPWSYGTLDPFASRSPPGLHMTYEALEGAQQKAAEHACYFLEACGVESCDSEVFQSTVAKPGKKPPSPQFFQTLEDLGALSKTLKNHCPRDDVACLTGVDELRTASSFELEYKAGESLRLVVFLPLREHTISLSGHPSRRTEVGIFSGGSPFETGPYSLGLMGDLIVLGGEGKRSPASFQIHSRHRASDGSFSSSFVSPTGLHPSLQLRLNGKAPRVDGDCGLYAYLSLPKTIFPDQYQLDDDLFMASKNLSSLVQQWGSVDLEAPAYRSKTWGSHLLVELAVPASSDVQEWTAEIPLHLRYLAPAEAAKSEVEIPYPAVFWACDAGDGVNFENNPFDRTHVGYDTQFDASTSFWHLNPRPETGNRLTNTVTVPVLRAAGAKWVESGTSAVIALGFGWVLWKLASAFSVFGYTSREKKAGSGKRVRYQ